jgi:Fe-S-cluster containining protein
MPVEIKGSDLLRLGLASEDELNESPKKVFSKLSRKGILRSYRASTGLFMLVQKTNSDCIFLDKSRLCTVYSQRPDVCRQFPSIGLRPGFCPAQHANEK